MSEHSRWTDLITTPSWTEFTSKWRRLGRHFECLKIRKPIQMTKTQKNDLSGPNKVYVFNLNKV